MATSWTSIFVIALGEGPRNSQSGQLFDLEGSPWRIKHRGLREDPRADPDRHRQRARALQAGYKAAQR